MRIKMTVAEVTQQDTTYAGGYTGYSAKLYTYADDALLSSRTPRGTLSVQNIAEGELKPGDQVDVFVSIVPVDRCADEGCSCR